MNLLPRSWPIFFALGFFSLLAQAVFFRHFLACIAMNELAIGIFFASWLAWVGVGALVGKYKGSVAPWLTEHLPWAVLLYAPAAVAQFIIIGKMRTWLGVPAGAVFPLAEMVLAAVCGNALVSFFTGFFFAISCRHLGADAAARTAVNTVYACEAVGGFAGGCLATLLPALNAADETCLFAGFALLAVTAMAYGLPEKRRRLTSAILSLAVLTLLAACCRLWQHENDAAMWRRALPADQFRGAFRTPHGRYTWGVREGQHIVLCGSSEVDAIPDVENASRAIALHLAQKPDIRRILIIGAGALSLASRWREIDEVQITWLHPDPAYPAALSRAAIAAGQVLAQIACPNMEPRKFLAATRERFDLIILHLGEIDTLSASRFASVEFLRLAKRALHPDGVLSWRIPGSEN